MYYCGISVYTQNFSWKDMKSLVVVVDGGGGGSGGSGGSGGTDSNVATGGRAEKRIRDRNRLIQRLHKSSDRQGKSKGGKGTGQDRRVPVKKS